MQKSAHPTTLNGVLYKKVLKTVLAKNTRKKMMLFTG